MGEVRKAKLKCEYTNGFSLSPNLSAEEAIKAVIKSIRQGDAVVKLAVEYMDNTEADFEVGEEEEEEEEED